MVKRNNSNHITLDGLAQMVSRGFSDVEKRMATKDDLKVFATKEDLYALRQAMDQRHQIMLDELGSIRADIRDIKGTLGPLARVVTAQEHELSSLRVRVARIEMKVGIAK